MKKNKRKYPLFFIDRSKMESYPVDYVICTDRNVGFIGHIVHFNTDDLFAEFMDRKNEIENHEIAFSFAKLKQGGVILMVDDFFYFVELNSETKKRISVLLKKGLKRYLYSEMKYTPKGDLSIKSQILQQKATIEKAKKNFNELLKNVGGDRVYAEYILSLSEEILKTLINYEKIIKNNGNFKEN